MIFLFDILIVMFFISSRYFYVKKKIFINIKECINMYKRWRIIFLYYYGDYFFFDVYLIVSFLMLIRNLE